ncbi:hypothetical protein [Thalassobaculum sp.]|uniref:hypothetical protein n=1 Tax=Thalassobaculum sp. TaxID=2022740 RepID=UPI0032ECB0A1
MTKPKLHWIPERKFLAAGTAGIVTWLFTLGASAVGIELPDELMKALVGLVMGAVYYWVPPSAQDVLRRIDRDLKSTFTVSPEIRGTAAKLAIAFLLLGTLALGGVAACASYQLTSAEAASPAQKMFALQADYNTALVAAVGYVESDLATPEAKTVIARLDRLAYQAIGSAADAVRSGDDIAIAISTATARAAVAELVAYVSARQGERP